jgi:hypothetical protein
MRSLGSWFRRTYLNTGVWIYAERVLDLNQLDVDEIATALSDQTDYEHRWLIDPRTGQVAFWTVDTRIDGQNPVDLDELDLIPVDPLPSYVWYQDMADFAEGISDDTAGRRLGRAIRGRGAFRRFKDELYEEYPDLVPAWHAFRDARAKRRAVEWLLGQELIDDVAAQHFVTEHPDPELTCDLKRGLGRDQDGDDPDSDAHSDAAPGAERVPRPI